MSRSTSTNSKFLPLVVDCIITKYSLSYGLLTHHFKNATDENLPGLTKTPMLRRMAKLARKADSWRKPGCRRQLNKSNCSSCRAHKLRGSAGALRALDQHPLERRLGWIGQRRRQHEGRPWSRGPSNTGSGAHLDRRWQRRNLLAHERSIDSG